MPRLCLLGKGPCQPSNLNSVPYRDTLHVIVWSLFYSVPVKAFSVKSFETYADSLICCLFTPATPPSLCLRLSPPTPACRPSLKAVGVASVISSAFIVFQIQKIPNLEGLENTQENEELFSEKKKNHNPIIQRNHWYPAWLAAHYGSYRDLACQFSFLSPKSFSAKISFPQECLKQRLRCEHSERWKGWGST